MSRPALVRWWGCAWGRLLMLKNYGSNKLFNLIGVRVLAEIWKKRPVEYTVILQLVIRPSYDHRHGTWRLRKSTPSTRFQAANSKAAISQKAIRRPDKAVCNTLVRRVYSRLLRLDHAAFRRSIKWPIKTTNSVAQFRCSGEY